MTPEQKKLTDFIGDKIHSKQIKMRPRSYFITGAILLGAGGAFAIIISAFFIGISFFRIRIHAPFSYLGAGQAGFQAFLSTFPWIPIGLAILAAVTGLLVMKKFDFSYHHAFLGVGLGVCAVIVVLGVVVDAAELPHGVENAPLMKTLTGIDYDTPGLVSGTITNVSHDEVTVTTPDKVEHKVQLQEKASVSPSTPVQKGDWARVLGEEEDGQFKAKEIYHSKTTPYGIPSQEKKENDERGDNKKENTNSTEKNEKSEVETED